MYENHNSQTPHFMKTKLFIMAVCTLFASAMASAQAPNTVESSTKANNGWFKVYLNYNPHSFGVDDKSAKDLLPGMNTSFTFGAVNTSSLSSSVPIFLDYGLAFNYISGSHKYSGVDITSSITALSLPVNFLYKHDFNKTFALAPYAGLKLRYNLSGKLKLDDDTDKIEIDYFDENEGDAKAFQVGYQVGVNAVFNNKFSVGVAYEGFFGKFAEEISLRAWSIGIGIHF